VIRRELQARPARWCASWGWPKLADRVAEWGSVSSCSRSAALAIKTPCNHRCRSGQEKYIRQCVCAAAFERNSCLGYCSSSSSVCCVRLSVRALLRADGRSHQEPTINPNNIDYQSDESIAGLLAHMLWVDVGVVVTVTMVALAQRGSEKLLENKCAVA
jgi:hypothetical protein